MTSWLFSAYQLSLLISGEITTMFSLKMPNNQIDTLQQLLDSNMKIVAFFAFISEENVQINPVFNKIKQKVEKDKLSISIREMIQDKSWVIDTALGKTAMLFARVPLKSIVIKYLDEFRSNAKFRFLGERFRPPLLISNESLH